MEQIWNFFGKRLHIFADISRKYSHPRIHQSRMVRFSLLLLRIYLLLMVALLLYKFVTSVTAAK